MNSLSCLRAGCDLKESWNSSAGLLGSGEVPGLLVFPEVSDTGSWKTSHTAAWWARKPFPTYLCSEQCGQDSQQAQLLHGNLFCRGIKVGLGLNGLYCGHSSPRCPTRATESETRKEV